ncbi:MAG: hypothetical protein JW953_00205 [Anaerolineae bacterium]|nr:hypothetical protein [Anaerolineae bacterium]
METITVTIPTDWLQDASLSPEDIRRALKLGLAQLNLQQTEQDKVRQALLSTGFIRHLSIKETDKPAAPRQPPPELPGPPTSEILISQRRREG